MSEAVQRRMDAWAALLCYGAYVSRGDLRRAMCAPGHAECTDGARERRGEKGAQSLRNYDENT